MIISKLSPYIITWVELFPTSGIITKHDIRRIESTGRSLSGRRNNQIWFGSKGKAIKWIECFDKHLDKKYIVRMFTDRQLTMASESDGYKIPYTRKQWATTWTIGR